MSSRLARILIVLTLALAVPIEGIAAATAGLCMAMGRHDGAGMAASHDHAAEPGAHQHGEHQHSDSDSRSHDSDGKAHCPPCVACCAAAAVSSSAQIFIPERPTASLIAAVTLSVAGIQPDQLDRPPASL
jgi:hypothetical protein